MSDEAQSMLLAPALLYPLMAIAAVLTLTRPPRPAGERATIDLVGVFLIGVACQSAHFLEELLTGLHRLFPPLFGLAPLSTEFFVTLNVSWIGIWALSAFGALRGYRIAYFPIWFFALAACLNLAAHPLLSLWTGGYFPGLVTSPLVGVVGIVLMTRLLRLTSSRNK